MLLGDRAHYVSDRCRRGDGAESARSACKVTLLKAVTWWWDHSYRKLQSKDWLLPLLCSYFHVSYKLGEAVLLCGNVIEDSVGQRRTRAEGTHWGLGVASMVSYVVLCVLIASMLLHPLSWSWLETGVGLAWMRSGALLVEPFVWDLCHKFLHSFSPYFLWERPSITEFRLCRLGHILIY